MDLADAAVANITGLAPANSNCYRLRYDVYFYADITMNTAFDLIRQLREAEADALKEANKYVLVDAVQVTPKPIRLTISSRGGSVHAAWAVVDEIRAMKVPVNTVISGLAASAATLISLAGAKREIMTHAHALVHEVRNTHWGKMSALRDEFENTEKVMDSIVKYYASKTKMTAEELPALLARDKYWDAQECLERGMVDAVC